VRIAEEPLIAMSTVTRHDVLAALALQCELPFLFREEFQVGIAGRCDGRHTG